MPKQRLGWTAAVVLVPLLSFAQETQTRSVLILAQSESDGRIAATREALTFWNETLAGLGASVRFAAPAISVAAPVMPALERFIAETAEVTEEPPVPAELMSLSQDLIVFLSSDEELISFTWNFDAPRALVAIRPDSVPPLSLPNVPRNLIAHEIGHTLLLSHNADATTLMCGRPADCRPGAFRSDERRFFPLTDADHTVLRGL
jgi:hypothetical protein